MQESQSGKVRLKLAGSRSEWEEASAGFPEATAFHRYDFLRAIAPCLHCRFEPLIIYYGNQKVGVAPLLVRQYGPFCVVNHVPFPYLGPLVQTPLVAATLAALSAHARRRRALDHYQSFSPSSAPPAAAGFRMRLERTFIIPLRDRSDADLMKAMDSTRRKEVRRAERLGLRVDEASVEDFELMDIWNRQLYAAQGLPPGYPPGSYERVFKELSGTPGTAFYSARVDGRTVGVQMNLASSGRVYAWQAGIDGSFRAPSPQTTLMWHTALRARDAGASELDLVGAPSDGIATYKIRLGSEERRYAAMRKTIQPYRLPRAVLLRMRAGARRSVHRVRRR